MSRDLRARALAYLRSGAVTILNARYDGGPRRAADITADVAGHRSTHRVTYSRIGWWCTCPDWAVEAAPCPHIAAVALVTGHPTPIRPAVETHRVPLPDEPA